MAKAKNRTNAQRRQQIIRMRLKGRSYGFIAAKLRISKATAHRAANTVRIEATKKKKSKVR